MSERDPMSSGDAIIERNDANGPDVERLRRRARSRQLVRAAGLLLGVALLAAAVIYATRDELVFGDVIAALRSASPWSIAALAACVVGNIVMTGLLFSVLMSRYGRVGVLEMQALTASAALLNFLPFRPGLFGRVAYHRLFNGIAIRDTAKVIVGSIVLTVIVSGLLLTAIVAAAVLEVPTLWLIGAIAAIPAAGLVDQRFRWASSAFLIRLADVLIWSFRYVIVFELIDRPIEFDAALGLSVISIFATLVPFISNGLGLREWAIGYAAPTLVDKLGGSLLDGRVAIGAELAHRGLEVTVIGLCGGLGLLYLSVRKRRIIARREVAAASVSHIVHHS